VICVLTGVQARRLRREIRQRIATKVKSASSGILTVKLGVFEHYFCLLIRLAFVICVFTSVHRFSVQVGCPIENTQ
jgi:hypothetical protein